MTEQTYIHVVDSDTKRRASIARQLYDRSIHPEIYETFEEFMERCPTEGGVLINDDWASPDEEVHLETIWSKTGYLPVAFFSADPSPQKIVRAMLAGALDYLQWPFSEDALQTGVTRLTDLGEERARLERRKANARELVGRLTNRERDMLEGIVAGEANKEIASRLGISPRTVEIHRANMLSRLNARSTADAVRIGLQAGLAD